MSNKRNVPLSFVSLENGLSVSFSNNVLYSIDGGEWSELTAGEYTDTVDKGSIISFKESKSIQANGGVGQFSINKECNVFGKCSSLLPSIYDDKYTQPYIYSYLFDSCSTIVDASDLILPSTTSSYCYSQMFSRCTSLVSAPRSLNNTLSEYCYYSMFYGCTSLINAPKLPATTLAEGCYRGMFGRCTNLVNAPKLPATTLSDSCYQSMYEGCSSLVNAPELLAAKLVEYCYDRMFADCSKLNYIKMLATDIQANGCLNSWVLRVASTGTFVKDSAMTMPIGIDGIPRGWTVQNA